MPQFGFDDWIDAQLRNVPLPSELLTRLAQNGPADSSDARLDAALCNVPLPQHFERRLCEIAVADRPTLALRPMALAASLFFCMGLGAVGYLGLHPSALLPKEAAVAQNPASDPAASVEPAAIEATPTALADSSPVPPASNPQSPSTIPSDEQPPSPATTPKSFARVILPTFGDLAAFGGSLRQAIDAKLQAQAALGANGGLERLPELDALELPEPRGIAPPRVRGYDLLFELKHGEHPFVSPAAHASLLSSRVPFTFRTTGFDLASRHARHGQAPPEDEIRVEDFLAAMNYRLPPAPASGLELHSAGCRSPLGENGLHMLQFAVRAASERNTAHPPTRVVVAVDRSSQMRNNGRWEAALRALVQIAERMSDADRLTLIAYSEQPRVLADNATRSELQSLLSSAALEPPSGLSNLSLAIDAACQAALAEQPPLAGKVVFITTARANLDDAVIAKANQSLRRLAAAKTSWDVIRVATADADPQLADLAQRAQGKIVDAGGAAGIYEALRERLTNRPSTVAAAVSLKVTFNPQLVTGYRLLGHEATTLTGAANDALEIDFHANQTATGLYEIWVKPNGGDVVANAELTWRDPVAGRARRIVRPIRREQLVGTFSGAPAWFQQGIVAAKTAEVLRGSYYAPASRAGGQILSLAEQVDSQTARQPDFQQLLELARLAEKVR